MSVEKNYQAITSWPEEDRPREKLERYGSDTLSDAELIAILLRVGGRKETAVDLARRILQETGGLEELGRMSIKSLQRVKGIGTAKAVTIAAAFQLGVRFSKTHIAEKYVKIRSASDVVDHFGGPLRLLTHEVFNILLLNSNNRVYKEINISTGHLNASVVHAREIFKAAIDNLAAYIILMHNHPSGNPEPSETDIQLTNKIVESGKIIGISVLDHVIIADRDYTSFADRGLI